MKINNVFVLLIALFLMACGGNKSNSDSDIENQSNLNIPDDAIYGIEQGYLKFTSTSGNIREVWFTDYGNTQYVEVYSYLEGELVGFRSWILDGYKYDMNIGSTEMSRMPYVPEVATRYYKLDKRERADHEIEKIGNENYLGYYCDLFLTQRPVPTTSWVYKGISLKKNSDFRNVEANMQAVEFKQTLEDFSMFELPEDVEIAGL
ncbi:MAG: hypothetical protein GX879_00765 [Bacteroidales bacterium]|nr:hypothetical protein [Bacteroidales bacterium]